MHSQTFHQSTMSKVSRAKKLVRCLSEPTHDNYERIDDKHNQVSKGSTAMIAPLGFGDHNKNRRMNFLRQLSSNAEEKIDRLENQAQDVAAILQKPIFHTVISLQEEAKDLEQNDAIIQPVHSAHTIIETRLTTHREMKTGKQRFRWNLLFNLLLWILVPLPFWIPFISNSLAFYFLPSIQALFVFMWISKFISSFSSIYPSHPLFYVVISILALTNALKLYCGRSRDFVAECQGLEKKRIRHIVSISCYKEPKELIAQSIETLAKQSDVHRITMVIGFEEKTHDNEDKCRWLEDKFRSARFERMLFTIHPENIPNEIPGKCSNANYGLRMAIAQMNIKDDDTEHILVTTCDADSKFPPNYIAALTCQYLKDNCPALTTIYQSPLFYNWKLDGASFVTRVTGLLRSFLMLGALIPFNINTMSIFSFSLSLAKKGNFIHPGYQMDDIICLIRWMGVTRQRLKISMVPVPVLSGPTSGETIESELSEWARQARRWTIGAAEVFHYFIIKSKRMPWKAAVSWGFAFVIYYGILLCTAGLFGLTSMLSMFLLVTDVPRWIEYVMYGLIGLQMLSFLVAFLIDMFIPRLLKVQERICLLRNVFHFMMTPFVLLAYSLVELYALHEVAIFGKNVCKHGASKKGALKDQTLGQ